MVSYRRDPYLWVHLAGLAAVPLCLDLCLLGLATGRPWLPAKLEVALVAIAGAVPILWMQWQRPFYIFSLLFVAIRPQQLTETQRQMLPYLRSFPVKVLSTLAPLTLVWVLWQIYGLSPRAADLTPFVAYGRWGGLLIAAIAFLVCNLFLQVSLSVLRVLWVGDQQLAQTEAIAADKVSSQFSVLGLRRNQILPAIADQVTDSPAAKAVTNPPNSEAEKSAPAIAKSFEPGQDKGDGAQDSQREPLDAKPVADAESAAVDGALIEGKEHFDLSEASGTEDLPNDLASADRPAEEIDPESAEAGSKSAVPEAAAEAPPESSESTDASPDSDGQPASNNM
ncbi:MAG: low-complexity tail membrane protein [Cyanobacteria bacterium P01_H01_bin.119]